MCSWGQLAFFLWGDTWFLVSAYPVSIPKWIHYSTVPACSDAKFLDPSRTTVGRLCDSIRLCCFLSVALLISLFEINVPCTRVFFFAVRCCRSGYRLRLDPH